MPLLLRHCSLHFRFCLGGYDSYVGCVAERITRMLSKLADDHPDNGLDDEYHCEYDIETDLMTFVLDFKPFHRITSYTKK
jgi:hypothetical protein